MQSSINVSPAREVRTWPTRWNSSVRMSKSVCAATLSVSCVAMRRKKEHGMNCAEQRKMRRCERSVPAHRPRATGRLCRPALARAGSAADAAPSARRAATCRVPRCRAENGMSIQRTIQRSQRAPEGGLGQVQRQRKRAKKDVRHRSALLHERRASRVEARSVLVRRPLSVRREPNLRMRMR